MKRSFVSIIAALALAIMPLGSLPARAATAGDLIKCPDFTSVYYLADDGQRYVFPNEHVYYSWYVDFNDIVEISCEDLASIPLGERIFYQAGTRLVKLPSAPTVYAVESDGSLRPIPDEDTAAALYGDDWAERVDDLSEAFFPGYTVGEELAEDELPEGMIIEDEEGHLYRVDEDGDAVSVDLVLDADEEDLLGGFALFEEDLEARLEAAIDLIELLSDQVEELMELLAELQTVDVEDEEETEVEDFDELEDEEDAALDAEDAIADAEEEIAEAEEDIVEEEAEGDDVTTSYEYLDEANTALDEAHTLYDTGDYDGAEAAADEAKHWAMWASGKAVDLIDEDEDEEGDEDEDGDEEEEDGDEGEEEEGDEDEMDEEDDDADEDEDADDDADEDADDDDGEDGDGDEDTDDDDGGDGDSGGDDDGGGGDDD